MLRQHASHVRFRNFGSERRGFTLVELLVIIAIIAILAALLLPALSQAKGAAKAAVCRNNQRQVYLALRMYLDEYHKYPLLEGNKEATGVSPVPPGTPDSWQQMLYPFTHSQSQLAVPSFPRFISSYESSPSIFYCPLEHRAKILHDEDGDGGIPLNSGRPTWLRRAYDYNDTGIGATHEIRNLGLGEKWRGPPHSQIRIYHIAESKVKSPSAMIAFGDQLISSPSSQETEYDTAIAPHRKKSLYMFCDGHVEAKPPAQWFANTAAARSLWNNDNQPHFE